MGCVWATAMAWFHAKRERCGWKEEDTAALGGYCAVWRSLPADLFTAPKWLDFLPVGRKIFESTPNPAIVVVTG